MKVVSLSPMWRDELAARLHDGIALEAVDPHDRARVREAVTDAQVLLTTRFDSEMAAACRSLELIVCPAAGTEGIDRAALPSGVDVVNGVGHEIPMAEYVLGALVALRQRFLAADAALRAGAWRFGFFGAHTMVDELHGSTLGIVGFGRIGAEVARRAVPFGIRCRAVTLHPGKRIEPGLLDAPPGSLADATDVDALFVNSDAVVIACELSPVTRGMVDARRLGLMQRHALLINVSRGAIIDEHALYEALRSERIAGAAIDVWYRYPEEGSSVAQPSALPFAQLESVLMTPHSSGWTPGAKERKLEFLARCINEHDQKRGPR